MAQDKPNLITLDTPPDRRAVTALPVAPDGDSSLPLAHYYWILFRQRWAILAFVVLAVGMTIIVSMRLTPYYESVVTLDVDRQSQVNVVGNTAQTPSTGVNDAQYMGTQLKLIQSDAVLRPVVQHFGLKTDANGAAGLPTEQAEEAPITIKHLKVTQPVNTTLMQIAYRSTDPKLAAAVANAIAASYIRHSYDTRYQASKELSLFMERQLAELKSKMERSNNALMAYEKDLDVINPEEKTNILSSRLLQLNTDYTNAESDRVQRQAIYEAVKGGSLEAAEASGQGDQLKLLTERLGEARAHFADVATQDGPAHPEYKRAQMQVGELQAQVEDLRANIGKRIATDYNEALRRETLLRAELAQTKADFDALNARSFEYKSVKQEADTDRGLYEELIRKIQESTINANFQDNTIRTADLARPALKPVFPDVKLNILLAFLFSVLLGCLTAVIADLLDQTVRDPEQISRSLKTEVLGSLPMVPSWRGRLPILRSSVDSSNNILDEGEESHQISSFHEAVRTLRDSILLSTGLNDRVRSLLVTSSMPREGKTTTSVNLAIAHSQQRRKTLLIDADLRRPGVYLHLNVSRDYGLSTVLDGGMDWRKAVQTIEGNPFLSVLAAGPASRRAADRVGGIVERILIEARNEYDLIIVDSPPLLGFAEPLQLASFIDGVVVVALAAQTNRYALTNVLNSLKRVHANTIGIALNEVSVDLRRRYGYYGSYGSYDKRYNGYYGSVKK